MKPIVRSYYNNSEDALLVEKTVKLTTQFQTKLTTCFGVN